MLEIVERTLLHGLRPTEMLGRWGTHEFLVICHERTTEMLRAHGQHLSAVVRTADFRWWGDRVPLTASVGAAQAGEAQPGMAQAETLSALLRRAQLAMRTVAPAVAVSISQGKA
jgi:GGDEF domain-containing protein